MTSLKLTRESQLHDNGNDSPSSYEQENNIEVRIFCYRAVDDVANNWGIDCIVYDEEGGILAKSSKCYHGSSSLLAEILEVEATLNLALQCGWGKVDFISDFKVVIESIIERQPHFRWKIYTPL